MVVQPCFSCGQLYRLFGYRKELNFKAIINALFYSISEIEYSQTAFNSDGMSGDIYNSPSFQLVFYRVFSKEKLSSYLNYKSSRQFLYRLEARMRVIELKKAEIKALSRYRIFKWLKLQIELSELSSLTVPLKDVFAFFEYRAKKNGNPLEKFAHANEERRRRI